MKLEGYFNKIPVYSNPACPPNTVYLINTNDFKRVFPKRKDGKPDMRYSVNQLERIFAIEK